MTLNADSQFAEKYFEDAWAVFKTYGLSPMVILAQANMESGRGTSNLARNHNNFFGITKGSGWSGKTYSTITPNGQRITFRSYSSARESFLDFGRLIKNVYPSCAAVSHDLTSYATAISQSRYISEVNGDNRSTYRNGIISRGNSMKLAIEELTKKKSL